jgi:hypothetical protein
MSNALKAASEYNLNKFNKNQKLIASKWESANRLANAVNLSISNLELEAERISLLLMVYDDYKEYIYRNKILLEYLKLKECNLVGNDNFATFNIFITSPLYILLLFFQIAVLFLKRLGDESLNADVHAIAYISSISQKDSIKTYLLNQVKRLRNTVKMMLNFFIQYEIEDTPSVIYYEYAKLAEETIYLFHDIFIKNKINNYQSIAGNTKLTKAISKMKDEYFSGIYNVSKSHLEKFDELLINMSDIAQATGGDVKNG